MMMDQRPVLLHGNYRDWTGMDSLPRGMESVLSLGEPLHGYWLHGRSDGHGSRDLEKRDARGRLRHNGLQQVAQSC
jgi:hypothetical protein